MLLTIASLLLRLVGLTALFERWQAKQEGRVEQQNADLRAENDVLRKERDSLAQQRPENPFKDGEF